MKLLPNIWGSGGSLFAFSGMDGATDWEKPVIASTAAVGRGLRFHTPGDPVLRFGIFHNGRHVTGEPERPFTSVSDEALLGGLLCSVVGAAGTAARLRYVFLSNDTVGVDVRLEKGSTDGEVFLQCVIGTAGRQSGASIVWETNGVWYALAGSAGAGSVDPQEGVLSTHLSADRPCAKFAWACSRVSGSDALNLAESGLERDFGAAADAQTGFIEALPEPKTADSDIARAYSKSASVLKVNCWSPQGAIAVPWTTPDRWPHANMWIWDSAFHAIGLRHISVKWAEDAIKAVLSVQRDDGFIPITATPDASKAYELTQPPILSWGSWKVYEVGRSREFLEYVYPRASRFVRYVARALDNNQNGLAEWEHSNASGMDNSPRFDQPVGDAVDLNCYLVNDMKALSAIARELCDEPGARAWETSADELAGKIEANLWDDESGFYYDSSPDGRLVRIKTIAGLMPLFAGVCSPDRAQRLVRHLTNPDEFWREFPVSSVSADEEAFCDNMWRGPVWVNCNYMVIQGLRRYGYEELADRLRATTIGEITRWYAADGIIYEFYDSEGKINPAHLHRKQRGGPGAVRGEAPLGTSVCDYNWSAALFIDLLQTV